MRQYMTQNNHIEGNVNSTHIIYSNQEASVLDQSNFVHSNLNNQTQMPGGDDDDDVDDVPEDISDSEIEENG